MFGKPSRSVNFTSKIAPVCLPTDLTETFERELGVVAGWGITGTEEIV